MNQDIEVQELKAKIDQKEDFIFIDVREQYEFEEANLGATLIPLGELSSKLSDYEIYKDREIVVHCRSGQRSGMAKQIMNEQGFTNIRNLIGGILAYLDVYGK